MVRKSRFRGLTRKQRALYDAIVAAGGMRRLVEAEDILARLVEAGGERVGTEAMYRGLRRLGRSLSRGYGEHEDERLLSVRGHGYCITWEDEDRPQLMELTGTEKEVIDTLVNHFHGVGHFVPRRLVETYLGMELRTLLRRLPRRMDLVQHAFWMGGHPGKGIILWPRWDPLVVTLRKRVYR